MKHDRAPFLGFRAGDLVLVQNNLHQDPSNTDWWMGWIVGESHHISTAHDITMFEVADADTGEIRAVNAEHATRVSLAGMDRSKVIPLVRS